MHPILDNQALSYPEKYQYILDTLSNSQQKQELVNYLKTNQADYLYEFFHHSHQGQDLMPLEIFWQLNEEGLYKSHSDINGVLFATSFQEHYNPISLYLINTYSKNQNKLNLFQPDQYNIYLFNHFFLTDNIPLIQYVINNFNHQDITTCFEQNIKSHYSNPLGLIIRKNQSSFMDKMKILEQFKINLNQYLLFDLNLHQEKEERHPFKPFIISPLTLAIACQNKNAIDYLSTNSHYQLGEYKEEFEPIAYQDYYYKKGEKIKKVLQIRDTMNEKAKIEYALNKTDIKPEPAKIKL